MNLSALLLLTAAVAAGQAEVENNQQQVKAAAGEQREFAKEKIPAFSGEVTAVSPDEKRITLTSKAGKPGGPPQQREIELTDAAEVLYFGVYRNGDRPTVGYQAAVHFDREAPERIVRIQFGSPIPDIVGKVVSATGDGTSIEIEVYRKGDSPLRRRIETTDRTRLLSDGDQNAGERPAVGSLADAWLEPDSDRAIEIRFRTNLKPTPKPLLPPAKNAKPEGAPLPEKKPEPKPSPAGEKTTPEKKPAPKPGAPLEKKPVEKPAGENALPEKKPEPKPAPAPEKQPGTSKGKESPAANAVVDPPEPSRRTERSSLPISADIDRRISLKLSEAGVAASELADDGEFLRRAMIDLVGRVPTQGEARAFLDNHRPDKRRELIDALLDSPLYGDLQAAVWHELIVPRSIGKARSGKDPFELWLAGQFNRNRGWNEIVDEMLTVEGKIREQPQSGFIMANTENLEPEPNLLADATSRLFWGVQLRCAECHDHPFAPWKQTDFWGTAAFFSKVQKGLTDGKNPAGWIITEDTSVETLRPKSKTTPALASVAGPVIVLPASAGKNSGAAFKARFPGEAEVGWHDDGPYRPRFSAWATGDDNPYFARNAVNRAWAHFFGRGFVNPLDGFHADSEASHPELLDVLASEFTASGCDLKHLVRCICNSQTYQRTSRPTSQNAADHALFSHMAVRALRPDVLYDSLCVVLAPAVGKPGDKAPVSAGAAQPLPSVSRDEFIRFFASYDAENGHSTVNVGIPQLLRLMNGSLNEPLTAAASQLDARHPDRDEFIAAVYLAVYSRMPAPEEHQLAAALIDGAADAPTVRAGLFWALLNSSEFVLNH